MRMKDRLLDLLSTILSGQAYKPLGAPPLFKNDSGGVSMARDVSTAEVRVTTDILGQDVIHPSLYLPFT